MAKIYIGQTILSDDNTIKNQIIGDAPDLLNTLDELAAALGDDQNYATSTATLLSNRLRIDTDAQALDATQLVNAKTNLGLELVTNESKATMFTGPTFTGDVTVPDKIIHTSDIDTALRFPADNTFTIETNGSERLRVIDDGIGINKTPERTLDMDGHFRLLITPENRVDGEPAALIKGTGGRAANLSVQGHVSATHDLFKNSGQTNGFSDNSNHFHTIQKINRITQQPDGEVKNIESVQEQYYAIESNNLRGSNAAFWNFGRVSRSIDNTPVSLTDLSGWNVQNIQDSTNRTDAGQVPFTQSENTTFTFNTTNPFTNGDILQVKIDTDFEGAIVAATHFAKVTNISGLEATVVLYGGNYKSTDEVADGNSQTALTTNFSVTKIDTSTNLLPSSGGFSAGDSFQRSFKSLLGSHGSRTGRRVFKFNRNGVSAGLVVNDVLTIITTGADENGKSYKEAEVATVISVSTSQVIASYGKIFDSDPDLPTTYHPNKILAVLKGSLDGLHRIASGDTLMNFNADNHGSYKSFQIGPGNEVDGDCIAIGKNVYNNIDKSIRIGYEPDSSATGSATNHLLITPTYTETIKPLSTQGLQALRVNGEQTSLSDITYDAGIHRFRDFDESPNDMLVIRKAISPTSGEYMPEALVGINTDTPDAALHIVGQGARTDNVVLKAIGSGLFSSTNNIALHLKVDSDNDQIGTSILKLQQDNTTNSGTNVERMNIGFIGVGGNGMYTNSTANAAFIEVENNRSFEISTGGQKSISVNATGEVGIGKTAATGVELDVNGDIAASGSITGANILFEKTTTDREIRITDSTAGDGGDLELIAGSAGGGNTNGGDISITAGSGVGTGANGKITIVSPTTAGSNAGDIELFNDSVSLKTTPNGVELYKQLQIHYVGVYADNTAALSAGLTAGEVYRTSAGVLMITF